MSSTKYKYGDEHDRLYRLNFPNVQGTYCQINTEQVHSRALRIFFIGLVRSQLYINTNSMYNYCKIRSNTTYYYCTYLAKHFVEFSTHVYSICWYIYITITDLSFLTGTVQRDGCNTFLHDLIDTLQTRLIWPKGYFY